MKKHVTESEVLSLDSELAIKLMCLVWEKDITRDSLAYRIDGYKRNKLNTKKLSVDLTIGKMIEMLNNNSLKSINLYSGSDYEWYLDLNRHDDKMYYANELSDVLWQAIKEVFKC